jgi:ribose transport system permease protein
LLLPLLIVAMELAVSLIEPRVLSLRNIIHILVQSSYLLLFASAQMVVILTGGFDLSLGMAVSVISVATALATTGLAVAGAPAWLILVAGLAVGLGVGLLVGIFNGLCLWVGINPFVVTLGSLNVCAAWRRRFRRRRFSMCLMPSLAHFMRAPSFPACRYR